MTLPGDAILLDGWLDLVATLRADVARDVAEIRNRSQVLLAEEEDQLVQSAAWRRLAALTDSGTLQVGALSVDVEQAVVRRVRADLLGLGGFEEYFQDPTIENLFINGSNRVFVDRAGSDHPERVPSITRDDEELVALLNRWASNAGRMERRFDVGNPRLDLRLPSGHRLHAIMEVTKRPTVTIRFPPFHTVTLAEQLRRGTISSSMHHFLEAAVRARCNIIVAGGTGAGKTTLLRSLLLLIPSHERIVSIEDTPELNLEAYEELLPNVVEMETRQANNEGMGELTMLELTRESLRMSPDRVVIGEVRGAEALYMLKAMSQGNDGSMCTIHADSGSGVPGRVRAYCAEGAHGLPPSVIDSFFSSAVDLIIHIKRLPDRRRVVSAIHEVEKSEGEAILLNEIFGERPNGVGEFSTMPSDGLMGRLRAAGLRAG